MYKIITWGSEQIASAFPKGSMQAIAECDNCGDDLEIHERLVIQVEVADDESASPDAEGMGFRDFQVVGCDRNPRVWRMWACRQERVVEGRKFMHFGCEQTVRRGYAGCGEPTPVELIEDSEGMYWGWIDCTPDKGHGGEPTMVQPHRSMFNIQFPYSPEAEVERGRGEIVRMSVRALS